MKPFKLSKLPLNSLDWEKFVHLIGKANAEVARFDGLLQSMPNPAVLLSPLSTREAVLSSKIEGTQATLREVFEYEAQMEGDVRRYGDIQEVLNYRKAMNFAIQELKKTPLSTRVIKKIHEILMNSVRGENKNPGNFRKIQVWIGKSGTTLETASYVPPSPDDLPDLMSDLDKYFHIDEKDVLVQLAIVHAQFELIHPFLDGNGRVGRILMPLFLYYKDILSSPMFYLSEYFESDRDGYYSALQGISENGDWEGWIEYFLNAVIDQSKQNIEKAKAIHKLYDVKKEKIATLTRSRFAIKTLDFIFSVPIFTTTQFRESSGVPKASTSRMLDALEKGAVLKVIRESAGNQPKTYAFTKLLDLVN
jgi:Fic family protein